jgi:LysM repeat protein
MEFEERNAKPEEPNNKLPLTVLVVLISIICLLLYAGWQLMSDDASTVTELKESSTPAVTQNKTELAEDTNSHVEVDKPAEEKTETTTVTPAEEPKEEKVEAKIVEKPKVEEKVKPVEKPKVEEKPKVVEKKETSSSSKSTTSHLVKEGDTYFSLAKRYNINANALKEANGGLNADQIKVGETKLTIPIQAIHTVGPGDILRVVADKYGISVDKLMAANGKTKNYAARGEKLIIPKK